jgi:hypothetical protein
MRSPKFLAPILFALAFALFLPQLSIAQYSISTVAGGGPNNLPALQSSIGTAGSVVLDGAGNTYISDSYSSQIFKVSAAGTLTVVAGNGTTGYSGDGGPATSAALALPEGIFVDGSGNIYIADTYNSVIREVASNGTIQTVAGGGTGCTAQTDLLGDGCLATSALLNDPYGVFVDSQGDIFIADTGDNVIREVVANTGNIQLVAGSGSGCTGQTDSLGDGCTATSAQLNQPEGVYLDSTGNIFISDTLNSLIRAVNPSTQSVTIAGITIPAGDIQTVAGVYYNSDSGSACQFTDTNGLATGAYLCLPDGIFVDSSENIYIADTANYAIREVAPSGTITAVAGTLGSFGYTPAAGLATSALMNYPASVAVDSTGDIFIADSDNYVVREVTAGNIQTIVGNNTLAYSGNGGPATGAELNFPGGVFVDGSGNVFIADTSNSVVREVVAGTGDIQTVAGDGISCMAPAPGGCGDGGPATSAQLNFPYGIFLDSSGNIYIADAGLIPSSSVIRVVNTGAAPLTIAGTTIAPGTIETVAGTLGTAGYSGDGGAPTSAELSNPQGVVNDASGNIFIADTDNSAIRVVNTGAQPLVIGAVTVQPGTINTVAGTPPTACADPGAPSPACGDIGPATAAFLNFPTGVSVDASDDIFIADSQNSAIRVVNASSTQPITIAGTAIPPGDIVTVAGTLGNDGYSGDNGAPAAALLNTPYGVTVDSLGNIFIADTDNWAIREVVAVNATIQTIAGTGTPGFSGDSGPATSAALNGPQTVVLGASGNLFVADSQNSRMRQLTSTVSMTVVPATATVPATLTQQFLATVTGATNTNVTWQVNGVTGGNATVGTVSTGGLYQAPATAPGSAITVTAISDANGTTSASSAVTIAASSAPAISVSTNPSGVTVVYTSTLQAFIASVTGETNTAVNWEVNGVAGGNSIVGTIDASGNYTAPAAVPAPALVLITAVAQADSTVSATYPITIAIAPAAAQPAAQTISPGGTANFSLALNPNTGSPHTPITLSCLQSSLPTGATCVFSPATITPSSSAVSFSLAVTVSSASASSSWQRPAAPQQPATWLATQICFGLTPLAGILLLAGTRRKQHTHWMGLATLCLFLLALVACGGGSKSSSPPPVTYEIQVQGTSAAQPNPVPITIVSLTVQ